MITAIIRNKLTEAFDTLYQEYVPDEQRASIEARIEREDSAEQAKTEAARRFAVYHTINLFIIPPYLTSRLC